MTTDSPRNKSEQRQLGKPEYPQTGTELLHRLAVLDELLDERPTDLWDLHRQFYFSCLSLYQAQLKYDREDSKLAKMLPLRIFIGDRPLTAEDAAAVKGAAAIKKRISARLRDLKAEGKYRPVRVRLDW